MKFVDSVGEYWVTSHFGNETEKYFMHCEMLCNRIFGGTGKINVAESTIKFVIGSETEK